MSELNNPRKSFVPVWRRVGVLLEIAANRFGLVVFSLALLLRLVFVVAVLSGPLETDALDYDTLGWKLSQGKGYVNSTGQPTAYRPPVYPLLLGGIYYILGHDPQWVRLVQAFIGAGICVLLYWVTRSIFDAGTAKMAGLVSCIYPPLIIYTNQILTEILFTFLMLLTVMLVINKRGSCWYVISGVAFGLALLTRPFLVVFGPFLYFWLLLKHKKKALRAMAFTTTGLLLILLPWTFRNLSKLDAFVPFANVGGLTFYNSYVVPQEGFGYNSLETVDADYFELNNEADRSRYLVRQTLRFITQQPRRVVKLTVAKLLHFVYPFDGHWYAVSFGSKYNIFWGVILGFSILGVALRFADRNQNRELVYLLFFAYIFGIMVFYGSPRFRLPLEPFLIAFAAAGIRECLANRRSAALVTVGLNLSLFLIFRVFETQLVFDYFKNRVQ
ncbi:hypothetical protein D1BOALGB6SA_9434 [Olavius sp. associated proteobacterium Delta 1]|nr:hypothetical protein D1BOALGB6SA_9434 [Olavius sp. associated proteobacterium Delta 1]